MIKTLYGPADWQSPGLAGYGSPQLFLLHENGAERQCIAILGQMYSGKSSVSSIVVFHPCENMHVRVICATPLSIEDAKMKVIEMLTEIGVIDPLDYLVAAEAT